MTLNLTFSQYFQLVISKVILRFEIEYLPTSDPLFTTYNPQLTSHVLKHLIIYFLCMYFGRVNAIKKILRALQAFLYHRNMIKVSISI